MPSASAAGLRLGDVALIGLLALAVWALARAFALKWSRLVRHLARISHERWLTGHRLTGLFVAAAVVHGLLVDPVLKASVPLKVTYLVVGGIGIAAYVYRELLARFVVPVYDYTVADVQRPNEMTADVFLEPVGQPLTFEPGQFIFLAFGGVDGWQRHPFSVASAPAERRARSLRQSRRRLHPRPARQAQARVHPPRRRDRSAVSTTAAGASTRSGSRAG